MEMETRALSVVLADVCVETSDLMTAEALESQASDLAFIIGYKEGEDTAAVSDELTVLSFILMYIFLHSLPSFL